MLSDRFVHYSLTTTVLTGPAMSSFARPVTLNSREEPATPPRVLSDAQGLINHLFGIDTTQGTPLAPAPPYHEPFYVMSATRGLVLTAPLGDASLGHASPEGDASDTSSASDSFGDSYGYGVELSVVTSGRCRCLSDTRCVRHLTSLLLLLCSRDAGPRCRRCT